MTTTDALRLLRLMADAAALRADPSVQRQRLIDGLSRLLGTGDGWLFGVTNYRPGRSFRFRAQVLVSNPDPTWLRYITDWGVRHSIHEDPISETILHDPRPLQVFLLSELLATPEAQARFASILPLVRQMNVSDGVVGAARVGPNGDDVIGFSLHASRGLAPPGPRQRRLARLAIREIARLARSGAIAIGPPAEAVADLPPRLQQILLRLLDGHSSKQIAADLSLSVHTVREHIQRLYGRLSVNSREELMAKFVDNDNSPEPPVA